MALYIWFNFCFVLGIFLLSDFLYCAFLASIIWYIWEVFCNMYVILYLSKLFLSFLSSLLWLQSNLTSCLRINLLNIFSFIDYCGFSHWRNWERQWQTILIGKPWLNSIQSAIYLFNLFRQLISFWRFSSSWFFGQCSVSSRVNSVIERCNFLAVQRIQFVFQRLGFVHFIRKVFEKRWDRGHVNIWLAFFRFHLLFCLHFKANPLTLLLMLNKIRFIFNCFCV